MIIFRFFRFFLERDCWLTWRINGSGKFQKMCFKKGLIRQLSQHWPRKNSRVEICLGFCSFLIRMTKSQIRPDMCLWGMQIFSAIQRRENKERPPPLQSDFSKNSLKTHFSNVANLGAFISTSLFVWGIWKSEHMNVWKNALGSHWTMEMADWDRDLAEGLGISPGFKFQLCHLLSVKI